MNVLINCYTYTMFTYIKSPRHTLSISYNFMSLKLKFFKNQIQLYYVVVYIEK